MVTITLYARQKKRHRCIEQTFGLYGRRRGWDDLTESSFSAISSPLTSLIFLLKKKKKELFFFTHFFHTHILATISLFSVSVSLVLFLGMLFGFCI